MSKRTPGPWLVLPKQKHQNFLEVVHTDTKTVGAASGVIARVTHRITWHDEQEANAHLIAAAPDLLEACAAIVSWCDKNPPSGDALYCVQQARAAIAKATGVQP